MPIDLPAQDAEALLAYEPERYWALWQFPEARYAYSYDEAREGWLIVLATEAAGIAYLLADAAMNDREPSQYRLDHLTLPQAFDAARCQAVPFMSSQSIPVIRVLGVVVVEPDAGDVRHIPL